jgi:zinc/manganese transport system substrate-binding protein
MVTLREHNLIVAMGKHLEPYLDRLRENLPASVEIFEAGRKVPSVKVDPRLEAFACCPLHTHGAIDPHWWHSPMSARRAVRSLGRELADKLPDHRDDILDRTREISDALESLHHWAEGELSVIPSNRRKLVTAHAAFGYFCKEYDFKAIPVAGLSNEGQPTPDFLAETIQILKENQVPAVFPEISAGAASLQALRESTGVQVAPPLFADFLPTEEVTTYAAMFKANVKNLVTHLGEPASP